MYWTLDSLSCTEWVVGSYEFKFDREKRKQKLRYISWESQENVFKDLDNSSNRICSFI